MEEMRKQDEHDEVEGDKCVHYITRGLQEGMNEEEVEEEEMMISVSVIS